MVIIREIQVSLFLFTQRIHVMEEYNAFTITIANLSEYNKGNLVEEIIDFPTTGDIISRAFHTIGIKGENKNAKEYVITDFDSKMPALSKGIDEFTSLDEPNYLANVMASMSSEEENLFEPVIETTGNFTAEKAINLAANLDCYEMIDASTEEELGRYMLEDSETIRDLGELECYFDFESYGRDQAINENGTFINGGYLRKTDKEWTIEYEGLADEIPEEYLVMADFGEEQKEEKKSLENFMNEVKAVEQEQIKEPKVRNKDELTR